MTHHHSPYTIVPRDQVGLADDVAQRLEVPDGTFLRTEDQDREIRLLRKRSRLAVMGPVESDFGKKLQKIMPPGMRVAETDATVADDNEPLPGTSTSNISNSSQTIPLSTVLQERQQRAADEENYRRLTEGYEYHPSARIVASDMPPPERDWRRRLQLHIPEEQLTEEERAVRRFFQGNTETHVEFHAYNTDSDDD